MNIVDISLLQDLHPSNPYHLFMIFLKSVTMMLGDLDYDHAYLETFDEQHFSMTSLIILLVFAIIMPILLMNLLVGLAIGDLIQIQQNARLKRLAMQVSIVRFSLNMDCLSLYFKVQYHTNLEKKLPDNLIKRWTKNEFKIYINKCVCHTISSLSKYVSLLRTNTGISSSI